MFMERISRSTVGLRSVHIFGTLLDHGIGGGSGGGSGGGRVLGGVARRRVRHVVRGRAVFGVVEDIETSGLLVLLVAV
jgi:hypothetical protein